MYDGYQVLRFENNYKSKDDIPKELIKYFDDGMILTLEKVVNLLIRI